MSEENTIEVKPSYASEAHRALIVLGFSMAEQSNAQALKTFSSWIDRVQSLPMADEELRATWSEFMRARFGGSEPPMTPTAVNEAAHAAHYAITMQLQLFPPRARRDYEDGQSCAAEWTELSAWRAAAKANGFDSPEDLSSVQGSTFGKFADKRIVKEWQLATGCESPKAAESFRAEWCAETNCMFPKEAGDKIRLLRSNANKSEEAWISATHCQSPEDFKSTMAQWSIDSGCANPRMATLELDRLREEVELQSKKIEGISEQLRERDQDLLTANEEIDRMKKAAQTLGLVSENSTELTKARDENVALRAELLGKVFSAHPDCVRLTSELAKVRAELQLKQRECQTEKERAERAEKKAYEQNERAGRAQEASDARGVLLEKIGESLQLNTPVLWDPLPGQVAALKKSKDDAVNGMIHEQKKCLEWRDKSIADFKRRVDAEKHLHDIETAQFEFTRIHPGYARLAEELTSSWKQASLQCATLSDSLRNEQQRASTVESMFRVEQQKHDDTKKELLAANQKLASAIIPLPKPESVEPGQKWARLITTRDPGDVLGSPSEHYIGSVLGILYKDRLLGNLDGWFYLGKS